MLLMVGLNALVTEKGINNTMKGYLGELKLSIPWSDLKTKPLKAYIDNLHILAVPKATADYDPVEEDEAIQAAKQKKLSDAEKLALNRKTNGNLGYVSAT